MQAQRHAAGTPYSWRNLVRCTAPFGKFGNCTLNAGFFCAQESQLQKGSLVFEIYYPSVVAESCSALKTPTVASLGYLSICTEGTQNSCKFFLACMWFLSGLLSLMAIYFGLKVQDSPEIETGFRYPSNCCPAAHARLLALRGTQHTFYRYASCIQAPAWLWHWRVSFCCIFALQLNKFSMMCGYYVSSLKSS